MVESKQPRMSFLPVGRHRSRSLSHRVDGRHSEDVGGARPEGGQEDGPAARRYVGHGGDPVEVVLRHGALLGDVVVLQDVLDDGVVAVEARGPRHVDRLGSGADFLGVDVGRSVRQLDDVEVGGAAVVSPVTAHLAGVLAGVARPRLGNFEGAVAVGYVDPVTENFKLSPSDA